MDKVTPAFHGTAFISVWKSYQQARRDINLARQRPDLLERRLSKEAFALFKQHGPQYPFTGYISDSNWGLTTKLNLRGTMHYATNWYCQPNNPSGDLLFYGNSRQFVLNEREDSLLMALNRESSSFSTPGAILVINHDYLLRNDPYASINKVHTNGFPSLPWRAILGVLIITSQSESGQHEISAIWQRKPNLIQSIWNQLLGCLFENDSCFISSRLATQLGLPPFYCECHRR